MIAVNTCTVGSIVEVLSNCEFKKPLSLARKESYFIFSELLY